MAANYGGGWAILDGASLAKINPLKKVGELLVAIL
jgi:hypothetical protein